MNFRIFNNLPALPGPQTAQPNGNAPGKPQSPAVSGAQINVIREIPELELSDRVQSDTVSLKPEVRNLSDKTELVETIDVALEKQATVLVTLREVAGQSATDSTGQAEREALEFDFQRLREEFDRIGTTTKLNGLPVLDGTLARESSEQVTIETGSGVNPNNAIDLNEELDLEAVVAANLGFDQDSVVTEEQAETALNNLVQAIGQLTEVQGRVNDLKLRLDKAIHSLNTSIRSRIAPPEFPENSPEFANELTERTRDKILVESSAAKASQANLAPQGVFHLINEI